LRLNDVPPHTRASMESELVTLDLMELQSARVEDQLDSLVGAKIRFHARELFPRVGFTVTNLETDRREVVRFYYKRGAAEQWIKEGKQAV
jgi:hypothetical protein